MVAGDGERHRYLVVRSARYGRGLVVRIPELGVRRQVCRIEPRQGLVPGCLEIDPADRYVVVRIVHQPDAEQREYPRETQFYRGSIVRIVDHRGGHRPPVHSILPGSKSRRRQPAAVRPGLRGCAYPPSCSTRPRANRPCRPSSPIPGLRFLRTGSRRKHSALPGWQMSRKTPA